MDLIDPLTSDNRLEMDFGQNRESLSRLANIFDAYPELRSLRKDLTLGVTAIPDLPISANSVEIKGDEYRQLLDNVDALYAERGAKDGAEVIFIPVGSRYVDTDADGGGVSEEKGYAYSEHPISPVQDSLETGRKQGVTAFKSIEPGWYLYYRFSISKPE